jgi:hypothetical protein
MLRNLMSPRREHRGRSRQLTLADWERTQEQERRQAAAPRAAAATEPPVADVAGLADELAPRLAAHLAARVPPTEGAGSATARLLTLDQLVAELPPAKKPETWKRWLYERTRRGEVPGGVKIGGMLFFDREPALAWLRGGATSR